jgi:hypothetical protein
VELRSPLHLFGLAWLQILVMLELVRLPNTGLQVTVRGEPLGRQETTFRLQHSEAAGMWRFE